VVAEAASRDQPDLGVDLLDAGVAECVADRSLDAGALVANRAGELSERLEATSPGPLQPRVEDGDRLVAINAVDLSELFFEQGGAVQALVDVLDVDELELLASGQVLGVFPQREAGALEIFGERDLAGLAGLVSDLAADLV
jgi:hypothetical protein